MSLIAKLKSRADARPTIDVKLADIIREPADETMKVRALTVGEKSDAAEAAVHYRKRLLRDLPETHARVILDDGEFLEDAKHVERLWRAFRDASDVNKPAFPDAEFIRANFTAHEVIRLTEWYERAERANAQTPDIVTRDQRMALVNACAMVADSEYAERVVDGVPRWVLARLFAWLSAEYVRTVTKPAEGEFAFAPDPSTPEPTSDA